VLKYFIICIIILRVSKRFILLFVFWEGLGLSSYFLVIFYNNWKSLYGGGITVLNNRVGDFGAILFLYYTFKICSFNCSNIGIVEIGIFILFLMAFSKRALIPFCSWLPQAMIAPTPISALVHSRTLITGGVIVVLKYFSFLTIRKLLLGLVFFSLYSIIYRGLKRLVEKDFKKVVAFSTLSQISLMFLVGGLNLKFLIFFHIIIHARVKFLLFLVFGEMILRAFRTQEMRLRISRLPKNMKIVIFVCILGLLGVFLLSSSISKEIILFYYFININTIFFVSLIFFSNFFTIFYSFIMLELVYTSFFIKISFFINLWIFKILLLLILRRVMIIFFF